MRRRLPGGRRGALRRTLRELRRDLPGMTAGALVIAGSAAALHLGLLLQADADAVAERSRTEAGLDVILCLADGETCDRRTVSEAEQQILRIAEEAGGSAEQLPSQQVRERVAGGDGRLLQLLEASGVPDIIRVDVPEAQRGEVRALLDEVEGVEGVQVRNLQLLLLAEQATASSLLLLALGAVQVVAAVGALAALTTGAVRRRRERIGLMRLLGAPERLLRREHLLRAAAVGAAGAGVGCWAAAVAAGMLPAGGGTALTGLLGSPLLWAAAGGCGGALVARIAVSGVRRTDLPL